MIISHNTTGLAAQLFLNIKQDEIMGSLGTLK